MHKYQFYISFNDKANTASAKAVEDCSSILSEAGYVDASISLAASASKGYLPSLLKAIVKLVFSIRSGSIVAIQYPLLSGNNLFKYFIKALRLKKVKFFCIVHDLDELRYPAYHSARISKEAQNLNHYDCIIVHNETMKKWLLAKGVKVPMVVLEVFDYISPPYNEPQHTNANMQKLNQLVFAGNLSKSQFIYHVDALPDWKFNVYGPNFSAQKGKAIQNLSWKGTFPPEELLTQMEGAFGLIWDGEHIDRLDRINGNYLKFNNPHKFSLYLAAGLPVIVPKDAAIGCFVQKHRLGILINNLTELKSIELDADQYNFYKKNVKNIRMFLKEGKYFTSALKTAEEILKSVDFARP